MIMVDNIVTLLIRESLCGPNTMYIDSQQKLRGTAEAEGEIDQLNLF